MNRNKKLNKKLQNISIDKRAFSFECFICKEKADNENDKNQYTYPISELANSEEPNENLWICKNCHFDEIHEKQIMKAEDFDFNLSEN